MRSARFNSKDKAEYSETWLELRASIHEATVRVQRRYVRFLATQEPGDVRLRFVAVNASRGITPEGTFQVIRATVPVDAFR